MCSTALGVTVIGHPSQLEGAQYARNNFLFNVGFLISDDISPAPYEPLVSKLAYYLTSLEMESSFLSKDPKDTKIKVGKILEAVVQGLEEDGSVHLPVDDANQIHLNISKPKSEPAEVAAYQVPIQMRDFDVSCVEEWDLTIQQVIPHIDGRSYVKQIAERANVHLPQALQAMKHLLYVGYIKLVDIFQYSNMYMVTPAIRELAENRDMQQECAQYVTLPGEYSVVIALSFRRPRSEYSCEVTRHHQSPRYLTFILNFDKEHDLAISVVVTTLLLSVLMIVDLLHSELSTNC